MGLEGFTNNASGGMSPGEHLYAKSFNKLAGAADKAQIGPSDGILFTATNGGVGMYVPQDSREQQGQILQQFEIVVGGYTVGSNSDDFSIIRVVKGEVVWKPSGTPEIPIIGGTCTKQTTITEWFGTPEFPPIVDNNPLFIGNGGIVVPNSELVDVGVYVFKGNAAGVDIDPLIVLVPDFVPSCPVVPPFIFPTEGAVWDMVKIGSVKYITPDPEADPPVEGGWEITQNYIGSLSLPGGAGGSSALPLPAQMPSDTKYPQYDIPFEAWITQINGQRYLQVSTGSCTFTRTNMPTIRTGAFAHTNKAWFRKVQICPEGMRKTYEEMWPNPEFDPNPTFSNTIMEDAGGFLLPDSNESYTLTAFKWDIGQSESGFDNVPYPAQTYKDLPTLALFAASNSADRNKVAQDCGPSLYEQTMNIQKMSGYTAADTELPGDWGHCHTTWMNPRKVGFNSKDIFTLNAIQAPQFSAIVSMTQIGVPGVCNTIQTIRLLGSAAEGFIHITATTPPPNISVETSVVPFFVTPVYTPTEVYGGDAQAMFNCINSIPSLTGKVQVSGADGTYHVTFLQDFQGAPFPLLSINSDAVVSFQYDYEILQYHVGDINLTTGIQPTMIQLMNKEGVTEAEDPYNLNKDSDPEWKDIVNIEQVRNCKDFSGDVTEDGVFIMGGAEPVNPELTIAGGCIPEPSNEHPFKVIYFLDEQGDPFYRIVSGTIDNLIPVNIDQPIGGVTGVCQVWIKIPWVNNAVVVNANFIWEIGPTMPDDTDEFSYIRIAQVNAEEVNQYITGSLWVSRIKVGSLTAEYFYARV